MDLNGTRTWFWMRGCSARYNGNASKSERRRYPFVSGEESMIDILIQDTVILRDLSRYISLLAMWQGRTADEKGGKSRDSDTCPCFRENSLEIPCLILGSH